MSGLTIFCPICGGRANVNGTDRPTLLTIEARISCHKCGEMRADFVGQITNVRRAIFIECEDVKKWDKPEREKLKEEGKRIPTEKERRVAFFKDQGQLFES